MEMMKKVLMFTVLCVLTPAAFAFTAPTVGDFGYDIYDIVVTKILGGPIGFVGGVALIVWGGTMLLQKWMFAIMALIAGTVIIKADSMVQTLGAII